MTEFAHRLNWLHRAGDRLDFDLGQGTNGHIDTAGTHELIVAVRQNDLPDGGEARGVNANAIGRLHASATVERVVVSHGVFAVEAQECEVVTNFHAAVLIATVENVFVFRPRAANSGWLPRAKIIDGHRHLIGIAHQRHSLLANCHRGIGLATIVARRGGSGAFRGLLHERRHDAWHGVVIGRMACVCFQRQRRESDRWAIGSDEVFVVGVNNASVANVRCRNDRYAGRLGDATRRQRKACKRDQQFMALMFHVRMAYRAFAGRTKRSRGGE